MPPELTSLGYEIARAIDPLEEAQNSVLSRQRAAPPTTPPADARYIVAASATGVWAGHEQSVATFDAQTLAWRYRAPTEGTTLWIDDEDLLVTWNGSAWAKSVALSVPSTRNRGMAALRTDHNGALAVPIPMLGTPIGYVAVRLNGVDQTVGDGTKVGADCYFSADGGATAKAWSAIALGDALYWQGTIAGFELDTTDVIDFVYNEGG
jgi:hypothetical protein